MSILPTKEEARFVANPKILLLGSTLVFLTHLLFLGRLSGELDSNLYTWFKRDSLSYLNLAIHFAITLSSLMLIFITMVIIIRKYKQWSPVAILFGYILALALFTLLTNIGPFSKPDPGYTIGDLDFAQVNITRIEIEVSGPSSSGNVTTSSSTPSKTITNSTTIKAVTDFLKNKEKGWQMYCPGDCYSGAINLNIYSDNHFVKYFHFNNNYITVRGHGIVGTSLDYSKKITQDEANQFRKILGV